jgi:hypothetical protein
MATLSIIFGLLGNIDYDSNQIRCTYASILGKYLRRYFQTLKEPRNRSHGIDSKEPIPPAYVDLALKSVSDS